MCRDSGSDRRSATTKCWVRQTEDEETRRANYVRRVKCDGNKKDYFDMRVLKFGCWNLRFFSVSMKVYSAPLSLYRNWPSLLFAQQSTLIAHTEYSGKHNLQIWNFELFLHS